MRKMVSESNGNIPNLLDRPIFVIGCNRSATTLLFNNLSEHPKVWSYYEENQHVFYRHHPIHPERGDRLSDPPRPDVAAAIVTQLYREAHNKEALRDLPILGRIPRKAIQRPVSRLYKSPPIRLVEKTPANSLRVPFLSALFPDAKFIFLLRRAEDVISSLMEGWKIWTGTGDSPWIYDRWHYLVPPGWQEWTGRPLEEICTFQWLESNRIARDDLEVHCPGRYLVVRHEDALATPRRVYREILQFCELPPSPSLDRLLASQEERVFTHGGSAPLPDKWRTLHGEEIERMRPTFEGLMSELYPEGP
ncbi:MAG: sulfotransferase [Gemmatimonadales bacterium]|nr:MAG: sulfotransferase [Gemmatimonadales bacterium]